MALPFAGFRFSSQNSVDVKTHEDGDYVGLVSVDGVTIEELLRHARAVLGPEAKTRFLVELARFAMFGGSSAPVCDATTGEASFANGSKLNVELEDPSSGEISEQQVVCTEANLAAARTQLAGLELAGGASRLPRVGLARGGEASSDDDDHKGNRKGTS